MFSHFDPAYHFLTHPEILDESNKAIQNTLDRFQAVIERINKYV